jgi:ribonuclease G
VVDPAERRRSGGDARRNDERGRPSGQRVDGPVADGRTYRSKRSARLRNNGSSSKKSGRGRDGKQGRGGRNEKRDASRLSRSTPIREVVREGQEVIVQVSKEPIGTKGARVTSHISLPGRYVVYMPTLDQIGISKRIGSEKERARLREAIESIKPPTGGLIVRTVAEGLTKKQLKADVGYLVRLWEEVAKKRDEAGKSPAPLYQELDLVLKTARDLFTDDIAQIVIDDREQYHRLVRFVEMFMPERAKDIVLYSGDEPIFDAYGIEDEIGRALSRKVPLPSGGHLIIDQAEALTAIDVNTGRYVGKGSKDLEDTLFKTNLEAVEEIAYQLRFRNLGGLIVLDLIDMDRASNREKVRRRLEDLLQKDKAKTTLNRISDLGLIEMTRKRTRESLGRLLHEPCFYCDGTGQLQSKQTVAYEILRQIRRERGSLPGYSVVVNAHPAVIDLMKSEEREAVQEAERRFMRRIELVARREYHLEQFDLQGK